jgi:hypothetical protein
VPAPDELSPPDALQVPPRLSAAGPSVTSPPPEPLRVEELVPEAVSVSAPDSEELSLVAFWSR